ncbi:hypothetical protein GXN76_00785 [Kroppenstedtia pulmonis]|uniref:Uncharacterized protein n=1 Tax=Kroppenstedtia pulmonis TaxID=1380685 RepID=A0A7D4CUD3_9BACL|nr:hypothetical protein [Kroppenstedtia pulmonis]QKG83137.1 hypothetical protein GXN76_00785 [Kroppenstedtia pulmonis]
MTKRVWRSRDSLGVIYVTLDKTTDSVLELTEKVFSAVEKFGVVVRIEITTESEGEDAYVANLNRQGLSTIFEYIDKIKVTTESPDQDLINFLTKSHDVKDIDFHLSTACCDETGKTIFMPDAIILSLNVEADWERWSLYIDINTDIFAPFDLMRNETTEEMARKNAPQLKALIDGLLDRLPVISWNWESGPDYLKEYLEQL